MSMVVTEAIEDYFGYFCRMLCGDGFSDGRPFHHLLWALFAKPFTYILPMDGNRLADGHDFRYKYGYEHGMTKEQVQQEIDIFPVSMLEVMYALAQRCEIHIMTDPDFGDRTSLWFWDMINSLGLANMTDPNYNDILTQKALDRCLLRQYDRNGYGGLFAVVNPTVDMRQIEIWQQLMIFLNEQECG